MVMDLFFGGICGISGVFEGSFRNEVEWGAGVGAGKGGPGFFPSQSATNVTKPRRAVPVNVSQAFAASRAKPVYF